MACQSSDLIDCPQAHRLTKVDFLADLPDTN